MAARVLETLQAVASDPEVVAALASNPKIKAAFDDVSANPMGFMAYVHDPDVAPLVMSMMAKMKEPNKLEPMARQQEPSVGKAGGDAALEAEVVD